MTILDKSVRKVLKRKYVRHTAGDKIANKDIFDILYPDGYCELAVADDEDMELLDDDDSKRQPFFVICEECQKPTYSTTKTRYTNVINHANKCYGAENLKEMVKKVRASVDATGNVDMKVQRSILAAMCKANPQDRALFTAIQLVVKHNIPPTKLRDRSFMDLLNVDPVSYKVCVHTMLELMLVVEDKIAKEMKGKKGSLLHDGWSRYGKHFVVLLVCYMLEQETIGADGKKKKSKKAEISMLALSTLSHTEDECESSK